MRCIEMWGRGERGKEKMVSHEIGGGLCTTLFPSYLCRLKLVLTYIQKYIEVK